MATYSYMWLTSLYRTTVDRSGLCSHVSNRASDVSGEYFLWRIVKIIDLGCSETLQPGAQKLGIRMESS